MPSDEPLFSIVIPTRNRGHLLPSALHSALEQEFDDFEVVVVANNCTDATRDVVSVMANDRIRFFETTDTLSMPDNWDFAWKKARGTYVVYLADDDALVPSALRVLSEQAIHDTPPIVSWEDATYYYPDWHDSQLHNLLIINFDSVTIMEDIPSEVYRRMCSEFTFPWQSTLPKMLNCIAHRETLEAWRLKLGKLFGPICPDYWFAWVTSHLFERIRVVHRPLTVHGISDDAIGSNAGLHEAGITFRREFGGIDIYEGLPTRAPVSMNSIASTFLRANALLDAHGVAHGAFDQRAYLLAVAKQLRERESEDLLSNASHYFPDLLLAAGGISEELRERIEAILLAPAPPIANTESIRQVRSRTADMARQYQPTLANVTSEHLGDEECARCVLGLADGVLADASWQSLYVFGDELGVSDPYGAGKLVDGLYDLMSRCREKRSQAPDRGLVATRDLSEDDPTGGETIQRWRDQLLEKEHVIAELKATADERLRLLYEADADARRARAESEKLTEQLQEKVELIVALAASADERLCLVDEANADATNARAVAEQLVAQLKEKDQLIASLSASADERLALIDQASAEAANARTVAERLVAQLYEKDRLIAELEASAEERLGIADLAHVDASNARTVAERLVAQLHEKDRLIAELETSADERLVLMERANLDAESVRAVSDQLAEQLRQKEQLIDSLTASADERLLLLTEATNAVTSEREANEALIAQLGEKERLIAELSAAANERLRLAEQAFAEAERSRSRAEGLAIELQEKETVINGLTTAAAERLEVIERLNQEMSQNGQPAEQKPW